jgi:hypothetical protein
VGQDPWAAESFRKNLLSPVWEEWAKTLELVNGKSSSVSKSLASALQIFPHAVKTI